MLAAAFTGLATGLSLILAIGAQNAFVLRQGLAGRHVFWLCLAMSLSDAVLIAAGVAGFGVLVDLAPWFPRAMALAGAAFLLFYGALRAREALRGGVAMADAARRAGLRATLTTGMALTWLNPHVYLDTLGLIGAISTRFPEGSARWSFGGGAILASFIFFFSLGYGARLLAPAMRRPVTWRVLDMVIALTMWAIAVSLVLPYLA